MSAQATRAYETQFIAFVDIAAFTRTTAQLSDEQLAEIADATYSLFDAAAVSSGGRTVKTFGDGALLAWPECAADGAMLALIRLRDEVARYLESVGIRTTLVVKAHAGPVVTGEFGPPGHTHYDIIGHAVMTTAKLEARTLALSVAAFRKLSPETRRILKRHTPPVVYIPVDDPRP